MEEIRRTAWRSRREIISLNKRNLVSSESSVQSNHGSSTSSTHNDDVKFIFAQIANQLQ